MEQDEKQALTEEELAQLKHAAWQRWIGAESDWAYSFLPMQAGAEIATLRARITELEALVAESREENERLKAALRPFAKIEVPRTADAAALIKEE